ncbi:MAG TPA: glutamine--fructose-6-phosphate transaminase (isomerizing) [Polyangiaceae bacterium LLY-WYZ-15_(1-7)]|nr:glutamine--fructose-6-phosphate transaminase (isomerizing) [Myxococcales bacterium]MAT24296.1 glutamine--fructose-6-phosphate transaminase (isomerizing) [Sandaracinus sp.]HJL04265.1 glutamine--fructose-6-phosphate transaminase (isomerizing) [Polyangiaceae bacterium LLY-WYZ-15_(1-7)]HJL10484.1 glutamine--fructose-6-phosphate transaminase (isomerizing) [Polyangiaceae bacterium LLY-WYZ-15_(1-7)]HJL24480.1 glutamine--fructose-6-phosphate transaminase (isomerizing) [Polyangiaceae bacterium LLY-WY
MCGIVGYVGPQACAPILLDGLRRLEYRGYDSAGLAVHAPGGRIEVRRAVGKLRNLESALREKPLEGAVGIGHTRWATHGRPSEVNAHPHVAGDVAVVHNGIIENHMPLRRELEEAGCTIASDTDTELVAHLVEREVQQGKDLEAAVRAALGRLEGAYAIAVLSAKEPERIVVAKSASPLVIGLGEGEMFCASDIPALLPYTRDMLFMEDGEMAVLEAGSVRLTTVAGADVEREPKRIDWSPVMAEKAGYKHFMLKEIFEQPRAMEDTLRGRLDREHGDVHGHEIGLSEEDAKGIRRVLLLACGTSHHATIAGKYFLEEIAKVPAVIEIASEFRGREAVVGEGDLVVAVSQSGETLDTLVAAKEAKERGAKVLAIANVIGSAIPRMADAVFYTHAGPEIGVASTKCFSTQLANLLMLSVWLGRRRGAITAERSRELVEGLARLPTTMKDVLQGTRQLVANLARRYVDARDVLYLGRGLSFPIALEGALKLKEISYVHAEGYPAGEMKHGPIALIDSSVPAIVLVPRDRHWERSISNLQEAKAREAIVIAVATEGDEEARQVSHDLIEIPAVDEVLTPFLTVLPLQLYAYYVADFKGTDVDQPRNLAKTVTVE